MGGMYTMAVLKGLEMRRKRNKAMKFKIELEFEHGITNKKRIQQLEELGFKFEKSTNPFFPTDSMDVVHNPEIEINSLGQLMQLIEELGQCVVSKGKIYQFNGGL